MSNKNYNNLFRMLTRDSDFWYNLAEDYFHTFGKLPSFSMCTPNAKVTIDLSHKLVKCKLGQAVTFCSKIMTDCSDFCSGNDYMR